jgi:hypothetical protein
MSDAENIATILLRDAFHARAAPAPFLGNDATATIGSRFFQAGGFRSYESAQRSEHLREAWLQEAQKPFWNRRIWHGAKMLSMSREQSNRPNPSRRANESRACEYVNIMVTKEECVSHMGKVRI